MNTTYLEKRRALKLNGRLAPSEKKNEIKKTSDNDIPLLLKKAQDAFNAFIRERDRDEKCICGCGKKIEQCGHFFPMGSYSGVRFDEVNGNGIAKNCNYFCDSPIDQRYEIGLIARVGQSTVLMLTDRANKTKLHRWTRDELIEIEKEYKFKLKELKVKK